MDFDNELLEQANQFKAANPAPVAEPVAEVQETVEEPIVSEAEAPTIAENATVEETVAEQETDTVEREWYEVDDTPETETSVADEYLPQLKEYGIEELTPKAVLEKFKELQAKEPAKDPFLDDPLVQAVLNLRKEGKDAQELINLIGADDPSKMSGEELYRTELIKEGLNEEEVAEEMERYSDLSPFQKKQLTKPIAERRSLEKAQKLEQFNANSKQAQVVAQQRIDKAIQETNDLVRGYVGKPVDGMPVTQKMAESIGNKILYGTDVAYAYRKDGSVDVERTFTLALRESYQKEIVRHNVSKVRVETKKGVYNEINIPDKSNGVKTTHVQRKETAAERGQALLDWEYQQRGGF